jgi:branched-chain amino acid transport system ATP-binding protein
VTAAPTHEIGRAGVGWVPDDRRVFPALTVARNLSIAARRTPFRSWTLKECFEVFSALEHLQGRECENLSGGEMQMVAIARVLMGGPGLVLLDEPSQGLAPRLVQDVMRVVRRLRDEGVAVLLVEQNVETALAIADRAYVLDRGCIAFAGEAAQLREDAALRRSLVGA